MESHFFVAKLYKSFDISNSTFFMHQTTFLCKFQQVFLYQKKHILFTNILDETLNVRILKYWIQWI